MERLLAKTVAGDQQFSAAFIVEGKGEHAAQLVDAFRAHFLVEMDNHFGVSVRSQAMAAAQKLSAEFGEVINLSVENYPDGAILVKDRLMAARQIDDTEAAHSEAGSIFDKDSFVIRAAMHDGLAHAVNRRRINPIARCGADDTCNSTHAFVPSRLRVALALQIQINLWGNESHQRVHASSRFCFARSPWMPFFFFPASSLPG